MSSFKDVLFAVDYIVYLLQRYGKKELDKERMHLQ